MILNPLLLKKFVQNAKEESIQPNSIDLTVRSIARVASGGKIALTGVTLPLNEVLCPENDTFNIAPGYCYDVQFNEHVSVPEDCVAFIICRSSLNRIGAFITSGLYDSGFKNYAGAILRTSTAISVERNARIATIFFVDAEASMRYTGQYQEKEG